MGSPPLINNPMINGVIPSTSGPGIMLVLACNLDSPRDARHCGG